MQVLSPWWRRWIRDMCKGPKASSTWREGTPRGFQQRRGRVGSLTGAKRSISVGTWRAWIGTTARSRERLCRGLGVALVLSSRGQKPRVGGVGVSLGMPAAPGSVFRARYQRSVGCGTRVSIGMGACSKGGWPCRGDWKAAASPAETGSKAPRRWSGGALRGAGGPVVVFGANRPYPLSGKTRLALAGVASR